jgi:hypothetical protein
VDTERGRNEGEKNQGMRKGALKTGKRSGNGDRKKWKNIGEPRK